MQENQDVSAKSIGKRIELIRNDIGDSKAIFSEKLGISQVTSYNSLVRGDRGLTTKAIIRLLIDIPELNASWILTGNGSMYINNNDSDSNSAQKEIDRLNNLLKEEQESEKAIKEKFLKMIDRIDNILARQEALMKENEELKAKIEKLTS